MRAALAEMLRTHKFGYSVAWEEIQNLCDKNNRPIMFDFEFNGFVFRAYTTNFETRERYNVFFHAFEQESAFLFKLAYDVENIE